MEERQLSRVVEACRALDRQGVHPGELDVGEKQGCVGHRVVEFRRGEMALPRVEDVVEGPVGRGVTVGDVAGGHVGAELDEAVGAEVAERILAGSIRIQNRKSVVEVKRVFVTVYPGGRRIIQKKITNIYHNT